jgi:hypothetical protein
MRLLFVYYLMNEGGSAQDIHNYSRVAKEMGHEVVCYGYDPQSPFALSREVRSADAVFFIFEWTTTLRYGDHLDLARMLSQVPRGRRFVIDCDGGYNERTVAGPDYNHKDDASARKWIDVCDSLSDRIYQPSYHPVRPNVRSFFFHGYDPAWERPLDFANKEYGMTYVGHAKFRYGPMARVLRAIEPIRENFGRIALVGHGWDAIPSWATWMKIEDYFHTDQEYLRKLGVEFVPQVPYTQVIDWMGKGIFSPVVYRPLFSKLRFVTCRTFETPAANTIPLFGLEEGYVREIYGDRATELVLPESSADEKVRDIVRRPEYYAEIVMGIRRHLAQEHSYEARLQELISIARS